jgi:hypothetical protein
MGVEITTKLAPGSPASALRGLVSKSGASLRPLHPGSSDPELATYYIVHVPNPADASRVLEQLRGHAAVTAAYIKPPEAMA